MLFLIALIKDLLLALLKKIHFLFASFWKKVFNLCAVKAFQRILQSILKELDVSALFVQIATLLEPFFPMQR
jgi:hypothetical protein